MLNSDIGIDLCGHNHILFKKGDLLPCDTSIIIEPNSNEVELGFYQGSRAYVKDNLCLGTRILTLVDDKMGRFEVKLEIDTTLKVYIEELIDEYSFNNILINEETEEDVLIRNTEAARQNYKEYIRETLNTIKQIEDKIDKRIIDKIKMAGGVLNIENVTIQEYELCQKEIEDIINPIFYKLNKL
jgi:hypothetical protein